MSRAGPGAIPGRITPWSAVDQVGQQPLVAGRQIAPPLAEHSGEAIELSHVVGARGGAVVVGKGLQPPPNRSNLPLDRQDSDEPLPLPLPVSTTDGFARDGLHTLMGAGNAAASHRG